MSKTSSNQAALSYITTKCKQIAEHPSQINSVNSVVQKYLQINISSSEEMYEHKLNAFLDICKLISALARKQNQTKNLAIASFVQQKAKLLVQVFIGDELIRALKQDEQFQIVAVIVSEILTLLDQINSQIFSHKFISSVILQTSQSTSLNIKSLAILYQSLTKGSFITHLLEQLNTSLEKFVTEDKKCLESLSAFFINLPSIDVIQIATGAKPTQDQKEKSFEEQLEEQKPKQQFKRLFQTSFLKLLPLIQPHRDVAISLYRKLDSKILSKMNNPLILADYFLNKFRQQPQIQIEVLSCLFILVGKYGLEFENFYPQLEVLVRQKKDGKSVYQMKNSKRFFKLVESALRSSKVPFKTIETMTKTIMGQILEEESEFAFWALSFFFNLTKKHRKLLDIIKEIPELQLLSKHYNPRIRSLVNELKKDLNKTEFLDVEKFAKVDCKKLTQKRVQELCETLRQGDEAQFKIPGLFEEL